MPELPEVETVVRDLRPLLVGKRLSAIQVGKQKLRRPWLSAWEPLLLGRVVQSVQRRGKWILAALDQDRHLVFHLGMTGQLTVVDAATPVPNHTHLIFTLDEGATQLRLRDIRRFGSATLYENSPALEEAFTAAGLGPEPFELDDRAMAQRWSQRVRQSRRCLKAILLDQGVVAGVGNIYADESLFQAHLHPALQGTELSAAQATRLRQCVVAVLRRAIEQRGSSIRDYVGGSGLRGRFQDEFCVYGRTGDPCPRCQTPIECLRLAGRSSHFCPRCQKKRSG